MNINKIKLRQIATTALLCGGMVFGLGTASEAANFTTTISFSPVGNPQVDTLVFNWSTLKPLGIVNESNLSNWSYNLLNSEEVVYTETIVSNRIVQPIGEQSRSLNDIIFEFALGSLNLRTFDNDFFVVQDLNDNDITTYNIYGSLNDEIFINSYLNGEEIEGIAIQDFEQFTTEQSESTPEPSSIFGYITLGGLMVGTTIRKVRQ